MDHEVIHILSFHSVHNQISLNMCFVVQAHSAKATDF